MSLPSELLPVGLLGTGAAAAEAEGYTIERSVRFNSSDSAYLSLAVPTGTSTTFTASLWIKRSSISATYKHFLFTSDTANSNAGCGLGWTDGNAITVYNGAHNTTSGVYRDVSAWYHITLSVNAGTATLYVNGEQQVTGVTGFQLNGTAYIGRYITNAYYFDGYMADIYLVDGEALTPSSFTEIDSNGILQPIEYTGSYGTRGFHLPFSDNSTAAALGTDTSGNGNDWTVNNISVTDWFTASYDVVPTAPGDAFDGNINTYAYGPSATTITFSPPLTAIANRLDLHARSGWTWTAATNLGTVTVANTGVAWPSGGSYAGWYAYANASLTTIYSISVSAGANWTIQGVQIAGSPAVVGTQLLVQGVAGNDSLVDVPTNGTETDTGVGGEVRGNYCTWNPLDNQGLTLANGNLDVSWNTSSWYNVKATIGVSTGKWYYEYTVNSGASYQIIGLFATTTAFPAVGSVGYMTFSASGWGYQTVGQVSNNNSFTSTGTTAAAGDVIMVAFDMDAAKVWFGKNGTWMNSGNPATGANAAFSNLSGILAPAVSLYGSQSGSLNAGQRPFAYTAPSGGFKALCTANLPAPVIAKPSEYFDVVTYTGSSSPITISGIAFGPDLVWSKNRSQANRHGLIDSVRGVNLSLASNRTDGELSSQTDLLTSFTSDGYTIGVDAGQYGWNWNGQSFVNWAWDAGDSTVSNTDGSITSSVRANPSAGFSVVSYSGTISGSAPSPLPTVGHGLGIAPQLVIGKSRNNGGAESGNWFVWHASAGTGNWLRLNTTGAAGSISGNGGGTMVAPTSTVFSTPYISGSNISGSTYVAYCFAPVAGYSSFGSYTGNGIADGTFVFTNHRPRWILLKRTDTTSNWTIIDTAREGYNVDNDPLYANLTNVEGTTDLADILSNGFKLRSADASVNANAGTYIYASFAEQPFQYSRAR